MYGRGIGAKRDGVGSQHPERYVRLFQQGGRAQNKHAKHLLHTANIVANLDRFIKAVVDGSEKTRRNERKNSFSNPENIENFNRDGTTPRLEEHIKLHHLEQLMQKFLNHDPDGTLANHVDTNQPAPLGTNPPVLGENLSTDDNNKSKAKLQWKTHKNTSISKSAVSNCTSSADKLKTHQAGTSGVNESIPAKDLALRTLSVGNSSYDAVNSKSQPASVSFKANDIDITSSQNKDHVSDKDVFVTSSINDDKHACNSSSTTPVALDFHLPDRTPKRKPGCLDPHEFKDAMCSVLGTNEYDEYLDKLFTKLDTSCDGYVDWNEFCTYLLLLYRENDFLRSKKCLPFVNAPLIRHIVHNRQEPTTKVLSVDSPRRFITVSKEGVVSVWSPSLHYEKTFSISDQDNIAHVVKRRFKTWVTDAVYMADCHKLAIASTSRDIKFFDVNTGQYNEEFHLFAMPDVPYCFDYWYDDEGHTSQSVLIYGDDCGAINILTFTNALTQLFDTPFKKDGGVQKIFFQDLSQHSKWVQFSRIPNVHPEVIRKVIYLHDKEAVISSSGCAKNSLVIYDLQRFNKTYVFKLDKGVECFAHNKLINILVTGSSDHLVRLWNPYVTCRPVAILEGHSTVVLDVAVHPGMKQVFSYSKDAVVKVWDVKEHTCVQTVMMKFPNSIHGHMPEPGQFPFCLHLSSPACLIVSCTDYLGMLKLGHIIETAEDKPPSTHETQLCAAVYNPVFKQIVTGCDSSQLAVWDIETGSKAIMFSNAHGDEEITAIVFDDGYRRLITGARDGTIKVWNFQNGHNLHKLERVTEAEVTGIVPLSDKKVILAVGWNQLITQYDDDNYEKMYVSANTRWKGGQLHKDDILTVDFCPPNLIATASFDGQIIIWTADTEKVVRLLQKGQAVTAMERLVSMNNLHEHNVSSRPPSSSYGSRPNSRPNSRHRPSHKVPHGHCPPVDKLLFLRSRAVIKNYSGAVLVSSEAGTLHWWSIYGPKHRLGEFYVPDLPDESVLAMCTKANNGLLVTGDTQGRITVWSIFDYCVRPERRRVHVQPPIESVWQAHHATVVSVEYIDHKHGAFLLTASMDMTAKLWSLRGHCVGIFGQKKSWNLTAPSTWLHASAVRKAVNSAVPDRDKLEKLLNSDTMEEHDGRVDETTVDNNSNSNSSSNINNSNNKLHSPTPDREKSRINRGREKPVVSLLASVKPVPSCVSHSVPDSVRLKHRGYTFTFGSKNKQEHQNFTTFLGSRVEQSLLNKQHHRSTRREEYGEIPIGHISRYGRQCSAYTALATPAIEEIQLPNDLPMSQRMLNRGYTSANLTRQSLTEMNFAFLPDTPPQGDDDEENPDTGQVKDGQVTSINKKRVSRLPSIRPFKKTSKLIVDIGKMQSFNPDKFYLS